MMDSLTTTFRNATWRSWEVYGGEPILLRGSNQQQYACEIEVESDSITTPKVYDLCSHMPNCKWRVEGEGSLRGNGFELVSIEPMALDSLIVSLAQVQPMLEGIRNTFRAAVHVHCNVRHVTREQYVRIMVGYHVNEPSIYEFVGEGRDESVFCVPWSKGGAHIHSLLRAYYNNDQYLWTTTIQDFPKYSGLNLGATAKYGSVEFRHLQTPAVDPVAIIERISNYIYMCAHIVENATSTHFNGMDHLDYASRLMDTLVTPLTSDQVCDVYSGLAYGRTMDVLEQGIPSSTVRNVVHTRRRVRRRISRPELASQREDILERVIDAIDDADAPLEAPPEAPLYYQPPIAITMGTTDDGSWFDSSELATEEIH